MGTAPTQNKVLVLGADPLARDNVRVLLQSIGYRCLVAPAFKEALELVEQVRPHAAVLDPRQGGAPPARVVAAFHRRFPDLRGRSIVLIEPESDRELLQVLDAYAFRRVRRDLLLQELWPTLDSLLRQVVLPRRIMRGATLVFDSFLEAPLAGTRSVRPTFRQLRYESDAVVADFSLEGQKCSPRVTLTGQLLDTAKRDPELGGVPILFQGQTGLIGIVKTNQWGEFHYEFDFEPDVTLEIAAREDFWVSVSLRDLQSVMAPDYTRIPNLETSGDT